MKEIKKIFSDIESTYQILKYMIVMLIRENRKLKEQIKMFQSDIDEIIKSNKK